MLAKWPKCLQMILDVEKSPALLVCYTIKGRNKQNGRGIFKELLVLIKTILVFYEDRIIPMLELVLLKSYIPN